jgi:hypothetical protein
MDTSMRLFPLVLTKPIPAISIADALHGVIGLTTTTCGPARISRRLLFAILHD